MIKPTGLILERLGDTWDNDPRKVLAAAYGLAYLAVLVAANVRVTRGKGGTMQYTHTPESPEANTTTSDLTAIEPPSVML